MELMNTRMNYVIYKGSYKEIYYIGYRKLSLFIEIVWMNTIYTINKDS